MDQENIEHDNPLQINFVWQAVNTVVNLLVHWVVHGIAILWNFVVRGLRSPWTWIVIFLAILLKPFIFGDNFKTHGIRVFLVEPNPNTQENLMFTEINCFGMIPKNTTSLKVVIHGYTSSGHSGPVNILAKEYFKLVNPPTILAIDWEELAKFDLSYDTYASAVKNTKKVGHFIGYFLYRLNKVNGIPLKSVHCLGHSLGAHICGFLGKFLKTRKMELGRITGLDAAGPKFENRPQTERLSVNDAYYVENFHTSCTTTFFPLGIPLGITQPVAHIDIYVNRLCQQEDCFVLYDVLLNPICAHKRAKEIYAESIFRSPKGFVAYYAHNSEAALKGQVRYIERLVVGEWYFENNRYTTPYYEGLAYYLPTNSNAPYALVEKFSIKPLHWLRKHGVLI